MLVKVGVVDVGVCVLSHLKVELVWAEGKRLQVVNTIRLLRSGKELAVLKQYCICCYVALSSYFKIVSTVTFLDPQKIRYTSV